MSHELQSSNRSIVSPGEILLHINEGLLFVSKDGSIGNQYSKQTSEILMRDDLNGQQFCELFRTNPSMAKKISAYIDELFTNRFMDDKMFKKTNPAKLMEYRYKDTSKIISVEFFRIFGENRTVEKVMVVMNDKTIEQKAKNKLEQELDAQKLKTEKIFQILLLEEVSFREFINESSKTMSRILNILRETPKPNTKVLEQMQRDIYSLRRVAELYALSSLQQYCSKFEKLLKDFLNDSMLDSVDLLETARLLNEDLVDSVVVFERLLVIKRKNKEPKIIQSDFEKFLQTAVEKEAQLAAKSISLHFFMDENSGRDAALPVLLRRPITHLIRNSAIHGLETIEERTTQGKSPIGRIQIQIQREKDHILVSYEDDGRGLDVNAIKQKAVDSRIRLETELQNLKNEEVYPLIFSHAFSTGKVGSSGLGLSVVRDELSAFNATIEVNSQFGVYTKFLIRIPRAPVG